MGTTTESEIAGLLAEWGHGRPRAAHALFPKLYDELRRLAHGQLRAERGDPTLQATAVVHEAYLRLARRYRVSWRDRRHFLASAARVMRSILVDYGRQRQARKRGGDRRRVGLDTIDPPAGQAAAETFTLHDALARLALWDPLKAALVEARFFAGLTIEETAAHLGMPRSRVLREWRRARAWLYRELNSDDATPTAGS